MVMGGSRPLEAAQGGKLWLADDSCVRLQPTHRNHVWSYDFVADRSHDGRVLKILTVIDEYERDSLEIVTRRRISQTMCSTAWPTFS